MKAPVRHVEVKTRPLLGTTHTIYELFVDGRSQRSQISPFGADEIEEAKRIGPQADRFACRITEPSKRRRT